MSDEHAGETGHVQKGKNPYYFTFFNEKNSDGEKRERPPEEPAKDAPDGPGNHFTLNYSTIDQADVARRPTMQNILKGAPAGPGSPELPFRERVGQALTATKPTVSRAEKMQKQGDPTPNFHARNVKMQKQPPDSEDVRATKNMTGGRQN